MENGLEALNDMLSSWATERLLVYSITQRNVTLTAGTASYTIGSGGTFNLTRPQRVEGCFIRDAGQDYKVRLIDRGQYMGFVDKTVQGLPEYLYYETSYALGKLYFYPAPDKNYSTYLDAWEPLAEFATVDTDYAFPLEYKLALKSNLAILLADEYGKTLSPGLINVARESKGTIKRLNARPIRTAPAFFSGGSFYDIYIDD